MRLTAWDWALHNFSWAGRLELRGWDPRTYKGSLSLGQGMWPLIRFKVKQRSSISTTETLLQIQNVPTMLEHMNHGHFLTQVKTWCVHTRHFSPLFAQTRDAHSNGRWKGRRSENLSSYLALLCSILGPNIKLALSIHFFMWLACRLRRVGWDQFYPPIGLYRTVGREFASRPGHTKDHHKNGKNCLPA